MATCGVPSIVFQYSENQHWQIKALKQQGIIYNIGDYKKLESYILIQFIEKMRNDFKEREKLVERLIELVDGKGIWRWENFCASNWAESHNEKTEQALFLYSYKLILQEHFAFILISKVKLFASFCISLCTKCNK